MKKISKSATAVMNDIVLEKKAKGEKIFDVNVGEPIIDIDSGLIDFVNKNIQNRNIRYTAVSGISQLKDAVSRWSNELYNTDFNSDNIVVTPGGKYAIYLFLQSILSKDDEVIILSPCWVSYIDMVKFFGGIPKIIKLLENNNWSFDIDMIKKTINKKTKLIILNNANNPTGKLYTKKELEALIDILSKHNIKVISDEVYSGLSYNDKFVSCGIFDGYKENIFITQSCSKNFAMSGWRIGFAMSYNKKILDIITSIQSQSITCVSAISQYGALYALQNYKRIMSNIFDIMKSKRDFFVTNWNKTFDKKILQPDSALYSFINLKNIDPKLVNIKSNTFTLDLLQKNNVAIMPGASFGDDNYIRISFSGNDTTIIGAINGIKNYVDNLS